MDHHRHDFAGTRGHRARGRVLRLRRTTSGGVGMILDEATQAFIAKRDKAYARSCPRIVSIWAKSGHVTIKGGSFTLPSARYFDHVYSADIARIERLLKN